MAKKQLTDSQQKIVDSLIAEFTQENEAAKQVNIKNSIQFIEDKLNLTNKQNEECRQFNKIEAKKSEAFLNELVRKFAPIAKKYDIKVGETYAIGCVKHSVYLQFKAFWKDHGDMKQTHTLCIEAITNITKVGLFTKEEFTKVSVGYPAYRGFEVPKDHAQVIEKIAEWIAYYKEKEIRDIESCRPAEKA